MGFVALRQRIEEWINLSGSGGQGAVAGKRI